MDLKTISIPVEEEFFDKAIHWAAGFPFSCVLDGNKYSVLNNPFRSIVAVGFSQIAEDNWEESIRLKRPDAWWFGYLGYDLLKGKFDQKNDSRPVFMDFPSFCFFEAMAVIERTESEIRVHHSSPEDILLSIRSHSPLPEVFPGLKLDFESASSKDTYFSNVWNVQDQIREGNVYEVNLCQYFQAKADQDGLSFFLNQNKAFPMPFAGWLKAGDLEIASGSPERYLKRDGDSLISQPIKGTAKRGKTPEEDIAQKQALLHSEKERAENMMIVDLVRNDLARVSETGTVEVEEMFGIYSFPSVFQMISTIRSRLRNDLDSVDAIRSSFPMGSMTGAPKVMAMELIERYERTRRGLYSGALGYFTPDGDFDFNVVIRSILYNAASRYVSAQVGGAIVYDSVPEQEYEECMVKAEAMMRALGAI